jgi:hypothetical protein
MFKYFTTKNIENYKYELSVLKNTNNINEKDKLMVIKVENVIKSGKYFSRGYFFIEFVYLVNLKLIRRNKFSMFKIAYSFLRTNFVWYLSNILTNLYIEKSDIKKIIQKYKNKIANFNLEFEKFIEHKN